MIVAELLIEGLLDVDKVDFREEEEISQQRMILPIKKHQKNRYRANLVGLSLLLIDLSDMLTNLLHIFVHYGRDVNQSLSSKDGEDLQAEGEQLGDSKPRGNIHIHKWCLQM